VKKELKANQKALEFKHDTRGYAKMVSGIVAFLIITIIGVMIFYSISENITLESSEAKESANKTKEQAKTVFSLMPIIALVLVAVTILAVIMKLT